jgi:transcription elongation factor SPT6
MRTNILKSLLTEEQIRKEMEGFIKDEEEEEEEEGEESGSESGKRKHEDSESEDDQLEEDDYDLIEENLGVKVKRKVSVSLC